MIKNNLRRLLTLATCLTLATATQAQENNFFRKSPRLLKVSSTYTEVGVRAAKYYITIELPETADQPLSKVTVHQREGFERIVFRPQETFAFLGTRQNKGQELTLAQVDYQPENQNTITLTFVPPIEPGNTFTIGLKPTQNPDYDGIYLLGITAYPVGENPQGLYLGVGRLQFYRSDSFW